MQGTEDVEQMHCNQCPADHEKKKLLNFFEAQDRNLPSVPQDLQDPSQSLNRPTSTQNKLMGVGLGLLLSENFKVNASF